MSEGDIISPDCGATLLEIVREAVRRAVSREPAAEVSADEPDLQQQCGAFVTLKSGERLRGCLGCFVSDEPIAVLVNRMAAQSATDDPRFSLDRIRPDEVDAIDIEISVLSPMRRISDPLSEVELGTHGIYIKSGRHSGTFLPQVAAEHDMDLEEFLSSCCGHKAGLPADAWKHPETEVYVYTAQIIGG